jgi:hypothetical protein
MSSRRKPFGVMGLKIADLDLRRAGVFKRFSMASRFWRKREITLFASDANAAQRMKLGEELFLAQTQPRRYVVG